MATGTKPHGRVTLADSINTQTHQPGLSGLSALTLFFAALAVILSPAPVRATTAQAESTHHDQISGHAPVDHSKHPAQLKAAGQNSQASNHHGLSLPNLLLLNEQGEEVALIDNLIQHKTVVINTIYITCTTVCPAAKNLATTLLR